MEFDARPIYERIRVVARRLETVSDHGGVARGLTAMLELLSMLPAGANPPVERSFRDDRA